MSSKPGNPVVFECAWIQKSYGRDEYNITRLFTTTIDSHAHDPTFSSFLPSRSRPNVPPSHLASTNVQVSITNPGTAKRIPQPRTRRKAGETPKYWQRRRIEARDSSSASSARPPFPPYLTPIPWGGKRRSIDHPDSEPRHKSPDHQTADESRPRPALPSSTPQSRGWAPLPPSSCPRNHLANPRANSLPRCTGELLRRLHSPATPLPNFISYNLCYWYTP